MIIKLNPSLNYNNSYKKNNSSYNNMGKPINNYQQINSVNFKGIIDFTKDTIDKFKDAGSNTISAVQQLFNKDKDKLTTKEVNFLTKYSTKEKEIEAKYQKKIDDIKDGFWDNFFNFSEKKRKTIKEKMEAHMRGVNDMRAAFEEEEKEHLELIKQYQNLAQNLNLSKDVIAAITKDEQASIKRQAINNRKKSFANDYGLKKIAGYTDEIDLLSLTFIKNVDDEKAGKFLKEPIINSMLFYGPTGCGKTTFAKALAEEADCNFREIKIRGLSQRSKEEAFKQEYEEIAEEAQENFEKDNIRTIVLIDEADRFFNEKTSSSFINYMKDLMETCSQEDHVTLFLTTNDPLKFPYELRSPIRIGLLVNLDPPNEENTIKVLQHYFRDVNAENIDYIRVYDKIKEISPDVYSNTHLKSISDLAFEMSNNEDKELNTDLIIKAIDKYNNLYDNKELTRITKEYIDKYLNEQKQIGRT